MYWSNFPSARLGLWKRLAEQPPDEVSRRCLCEARDDGYALPFLERDYLVQPSSGRIAGPEQDRLLEDPEFELLLLTYLTQCLELPLAERWISEKDLPGGSTFFRGPHALPVQPLLARFARDLPAFRRAGQALGGQLLQFGDLSFRFPTLPRIPSACVLWREDEEFPARFTMMFDGSLAQQLPLDVVLALVHCFGVRLLEQAG
jgi:hypothetical protein